MGHNVLYTNGVTHLFLDEVHRYPNWITMVKNIYDSYPKQGDLLVDSKYLFEIGFGNKIPLWLFCMLY